MIQPQHSNQTIPPLFHDEAIAAASVLAAKSVGTLNLPKKVPTADSITEFGAAMGDAYRYVRADLLEEFPTNLEHLMGVVAREIWYAAWDAAHYMQLRGLTTRVAGSAETTPWTAEMYARMDGWANTLFNELGSIEPAAVRNEFLIDTPFSTLISDEHLMAGASLYWFNFAQQALQCNDLDSAHNWLHEAYEARLLKNGTYMWGEGFKLGKEEVLDQANSKVRSELGKKAAAARHVENRAMKQTVFNWCDENMARFTSMDAAAFDIAETFVPQKFRTVRDWMAEWKKLRSAGTP